MQRHTRWMFWLGSPLIVFAVIVRDPPRNPPIDPALSIENAMQVPVHIRQFLRRSCYDCHSSETRWPWYSHVWPVSSFIESDVKRGRSAINFSDWAQSSGASRARAAGTLLAACTAITQGIMPKAPYPYLHPAARPSKKDAKSFCDWAQQAARPEFTTNLRRTHNSQ